MDPFFILDTPKSFEEASAAKPNPFAALADLRKDRFGDQHTL